MNGLMQNRPLMISSIIQHAARNHAHTEIVSKTTEGPVHRTTYAETERRMRRLARAMQRLGVKPGDRVGTLAWNGFRHLEAYYAAPGMGAMYHTINPRLGVDDVAYIIEDAGDAVLFADISFVPLLEALAPRIAVRHVVMMTDEATMPEVKLAPGMSLHCYETLMAAADEDYAWPEFDELTAAGLCYTSGTTGRPKGVLYSHRSTVLHAYAVNMADVFGLRASDRVMPVVPMFHVNAWGTPFAAPMVGAAMILPGRHLDGASLATLMNEERVTMSAGVPTIWLGLLQPSSGHRRAAGHREVPGDRRLRLPAHADRRVPARIRRACGPRLGDVGNEPARHLQQAEGRRGCHGARGPGQAAAEPGPWHFWRADEDRG